jgi:flavodoxin
MQRVFKSRIAVSVNGLAAFIFSILLCMQTGAAAETVIADASMQGQKPLLVYFSRGGNTRIVARELAASLGAESVEIKSKLNRQEFSGILTCLLDQLLDRDDDPEPTPVDMASHNPVIIASPVWLKTLSSPARTFIQQHDFKGKDVYIVLTYNGKARDDIDAKLKEIISPRGGTYGGLFTLLAKGKDEQGLRDEAKKLSEKMRPQLAAKNAGVASLNPGNKGL